MDTMNLINSNIVANTIKPGIIPTYPVLKRTKLNFALPLTNEIAVYTFDYSGNGYTYLYDGATSSFLDEVPDSLADLGLTIHTSSDITTSIVSNRCIFSITNGTFANAAGEAYSPASLASPSYGRFSVQSGTADFQIAMRLSGNNASRSSSVNISEGRVADIDFTAAKESFEAKYPLSTIPAREIAGLDSNINNFVGNFDTLYRTMCEYLAKFIEYWNIDGGFYYRWFEVGSIGNDDAALGNEPGVYAAAYKKEITTSDPFYSEIRGYTRNEIINRCARIAAQLTNYWQLAYSAALTLGFYLPETWDCCLTLKSAYSYHPEYIKWLPLQFANSGPTSTYDKNTYLTQDFILSVEMAQLTLNPDIIPLFSSASGSFRQFKTLSNGHQLYTADSLILGEGDRGYHLADNHNFQIDSLSPFHFWQKVFNKIDTIEIDEKLILSGYNLFVYDGNYNLTYYVNNSPFLSTAHLLESWVAGYQNPITYIVTSYDYTTADYFTDYLANSVQYSDTNYYSLMEQHDAIWQDLYTTYPGVFRESTYINDDAATSSQLFEAANKELQVLAEPEISYDITGLDIYMKDKEYSPLNMTLGDQIAIDYQEDAYRNDTLYQALNEPLYLTGITHSLRSDGDYRFSVVTSKATDIMLKRFARILNFGRGNR